MFFLVCFFFRVLHFKVANCGYLLFKSCLETDVGVWKMYINQKVEAGPVTLMEMENTFRSHEGFCINEVKTHSVCCLK